MTYQRNKPKTPFVGLSDKLYSTGNKSPMYEFERKANSFKFMCSITKKKYRFSEYLKWWQSPEIQNYVRQGYELWIQTKTQEPYQPPQFGENIEQVLTFRMKAPYKPRNKTGTFKTLAESAPTVQSYNNFAPDNAKPINHNDLEKIDPPVNNYQREPGDELDEEFDDKITF